jgi:ATP-dependent RNA helicase DDX52/ROK1
VTFFAEDDVGHLKSVANVMRASGCEVPEWMLALKKSDQRVKVRLRLGERLLLGRAGLCWAGRG